MTPTGPFAPFAHGSFAVLWTAGMVSNVGTWMHDVAAGWLMTSLSPSPLAVSLVQASTTAAMALFALPAGAMADLFDRRTLLITLNFVRLALAFVLAGLTLTGLVDAWSLLAITFLLGACSALIAPAWQAIVPGLVPKDILPQAVAMNSMGINVARAIGPAAGGALIVAVGIAPVFLINGLSELVVAAALLLWRPARDPILANRERFLPAIMAGLRFASASDRLRIVLIRAAAFFFFAAAYWALLPVLVRSVLGGGPEGFGVVMSAVGAGAVAAALLLPRLNRLFGGPEGLTRAGTAGTALALAMFALVPSLPAAVVAAFGAGVAWILTLSSLNVAAQSALPDWVRGRGLSIYGLVFYAAMTAGSLAWGALATSVGIAAAFLAAAVGMVGGLLATRRYPLGADAIDHTPTLSWPEPVAAAPVATDKGPVMITVEYRIDPARRDAFLAALSRVGQERRRNGAFSWAVFEDPADPGRVVEVFEEANWGEHMNHHARLSRSDADEHDAVRRFHAGAEGPKVTHLLSVRT